MENSDLIPDTEWRGMLSTAFGELSSVMAESGLRYYESEDNLTTDGGATYALPDDHLSTIGVDYRVNASTGEYRQLYELMVQERTYFTNTGASEARAFALAGSNIVLYPTPPTGQTYRHVYVPQPADLSTEADDYDVDVVTPDGEDFLIWRAALLAIHKEEGDTSVAMANAERARARLYEWAVRRSMNNPRRLMTVGPDYPVGWDPADWWH